MWNLNAFCYSLVFLETTEGSPWLIDERRKDDIVSAANFVKKQLSKNRTGINSSEEIFKILVSKNYHQDIDNKDLSLDDAIRLLTLKSVPLPSVSFISKEDYSTMMNKIEYIGFTERSYSSLSSFLGSSRHVLLKTLQLKGIGVNDLLNRANYYHSWGGYPFRDSLKAIMCNCIINDRTSLGAVDIFGVILYREQYIKDLPLVILLRDCDTYRLSQISKDYTSNSDMIKLQDFINQKFNHMTPEGILEIIVKNYVDAFLYGIRHKSINRENLLIDGRFIDTESVVFTPKRTPYPYFSTIYIPKQYSESLIGKPLKEVLGIGDPFLLSTSFLHDLRLAYILTLKSYEVIYGRKIKYKENLVESLFPEDISPWNELLKYQSSFEYFEETKEIDRSKLYTWDSRLDSSFRDMIITSEMKYSDGRREVTFESDNQNGNMTPYQYTMRSLSLLEKIVHPKEHNLNIACSEWKKVENFCKSL